MKALCKVGIVVAMLIVNNEVFSWFCLLVLAALFLAKIAKAGMKDD